MIGSAKLILKTITNGARKNNSNHMYGMATIKCFHKFSLRELLLFMSIPDTSHPVRSDCHFPKKDKLHLPI